jgi:hypothetical protein
MPRQPVEQEAEVGSAAPGFDPADLVIGSGEDAPPPVQRTPQGEPIKDGIVQRVAPRTEPGQRINDLTPAQRAAQEASQHAPAKAAPTPEDLVEIPDYPYIAFLKDILPALAMKEGWAAVATDMIPTHFNNLPRMYRLLRTCHARGIYGDRKGGTIAADVAAI